MSPLLTFHLEIDPLNKEKQAEQLFFIVLIREISHFLADHAFEKCNIQTWFQSNLHALYTPSI